MKIIQERTAVLTREEGRARYTIVESATNYYVTIHPIGWALPVADNWKISKRKCANMLDACTKIYNEWKASVCGRVIKKF